MKKRVLLKDIQENEIYPRPALPVGFVILLNNALDPNTYFIGTWEKIEEEIFFMTASSSYPVGQVSGSNTHTLTIEEMPRHTHGLFIGWDGPNSVWVPNGTQKNSQWDSRGDSMTEVGNSKPFDVRPRRYTVNAWVRIS